MDGSLEQLFKLTEKVVVLEQNVLILSKHIETLIMKQNEVSSKIVPQGTLKFS